MGYSPASAIPLSSFGAPTANISMNTHKFTSLLDGTTALDSAGWDQLPGAGNQYAYVVSGCVWTADAPGSTLVASMSAGTVMVGGLLYTVAAVTSRTFTASVETYVDINISAGAAVVNYTTVTNWGTSPALVSGGTVLNTIRVAVISSGSSSIAAAGVGTGAQGAITIAGTQLNTTVAAGSNGQSFQALTGNLLDVASTTGAVATGGLCQVVHASLGTYTGKYTGLTTNTSLNGITSGNVLSAPATSTVSTGDVVTGFCPISVADNIGNLIYPTSPYPRLLAATQNSNSDTSTLTTFFPLPRLVCPFIIPAGPSRLVRFSLFLSLLTSSAAAGTNITTGISSDLFVTFPAGGVAKVSVTADSGLVQYVTGVARLAAGTYYANPYLTQAAAGTLTYGAVGQLNQFTVQAL